MLVSFFSHNFLLFPKCFLLFPKQISVFESHLFCCLQILSISTIPQFVILLKVTGICRKKGFKKDRGKRRKWWLSAFSPLPTFFSTLSKTNFIIWAIFDLSSANPFNLGQSKKGSFGNRLTYTVTG